MTQCGQIRTPRLAAVDVIKSLLSSLVVELGTESFVVRGYTNRECRWDLRRVDVFRWLKPVNKDRDQDLAVQTWLENALKNSPLVPRDQWKFKKSYDLWKGYIACVAISPELAKQLEANKNMVKGGFHTITFEKAHTIKPYLAKQAAMVSNGQIPQEDLDMATFRPKLTPSSAPDPLQELDAPEQEPDDLAAGLSARRRSPCQQPQCCWSGSQTPLL